MFIMQTLCIVEDVEYVCGVGDSLAPAMTSKYECCRRVDCQMECYNIIPPYLNVHPNAMKLWKEEAAMVKQELHSKQASISAGQIGCECDDTQRLDTDLSLDGVNVVLGSDTRRHADTNARGEAI